MARAQRPDNLPGGGGGGHHWTSPAQRPATITTVSRAESMRLYLTPGLRPGLEGSRRHPDPRPHPPRAQARGYVTRLTCAPALPRVCAAPKLVSMANPETIAARFARCVDVFRDPVATEAQEAEFRALVELLDDVPLTLTGRAGRIEVNGVPCDAEEMIGLVRQFGVHRVSAIALGRRPPPERLLELIEALADQPRGGEIAARLREFGTDPIRVTLASPGASTPRAGPAVSGRHGFAAREPVLPPPDAVAAPLGTNGILRGDALGEIASVRLENVPPVTHDLPPPPARVALPGQSE